MKKYLIIGAVVVAGAISSLFLFGGSSPTLSQAQFNRDAVKEYHAMWPTLDQTGLTAQCAYDPSKLAVAYQFPCYIYQSDNHEIAQLDYTITTNNDKETLFNVSGHLK